ncbi:pimeloyl-ACP methyl ester carboxylesterase [Aminobacter lissarensis]|uniref:Pimeloyl-ACP methyl ester carboxylesterase n=1 Tax=Aminobacter carboxidus TaxID=376165 RepID=A0A8E2BDJ5_9HYPH|nr:alpha/beta hydrolase [Aminobacter lissarensis]MBB6466837.1 pimeloyl-ACP methyl ester carboxylesterase [Aminobacter lissarensis]
MTGTQGFADFFYTSQEGLRLHARIYGDEPNRSETTRPVVCLPGLTRNARDFHNLALHLANDPEKPRRIICFDYRGRGQSSYDPNWQNYNVGVEAADIIAGLDALGVTEAAFIGTSRGGLIIHVLTMTRPALIKAVVLNDIGPVIETAGLAHIRAYLENASRPVDFAEAVRVQKTVHGDAFPALSDADWHRFVHAIYRDEAGTPVADYDPALLNTVMAMDLSQPLPELWPQFEVLASVPMLAIRGANSRLLSAETLEEMRRRHPQFAAFTVEGQGHAPLLETGKLPARIADFLREADTATAFPAKA